MVWSDDEPYTKNGCVGRENEKSTRGNRVSRRQTDVLPKSRGFESTWLPKFDSATVLSFSRLYLKIDSILSYNTKHTTQHLYLPSLWVERWVSQLSETRRLPHCERLLLSIFSRCFCSHVEETQLTTTQTTFLFTVLFQHFYCSIQLATRQVGSRHHKQTKRGKEGERLLTTTADVCVVAVVVFYVPIAISTSTSNLLPWSICVTLTQK